MGIMKSGAQREEREVGAAKICAVAFSAFSASLR
jgi:hypothetical protein